jgi:hypothetical protein
MVSLVIAVAASTPGMEDLASDYHVPIWAKALAKNFIVTLAPDFAEEVSVNSNLESMGRFMGKFAKAFTLVKAEFTPQQRIIYEPFVTLSEEILQLGINSSSDLPIEDRNRFLVAYAQGLEWNGLDKVVANGAINVGSPRFLMVAVLLLKWPEVEAAGTTRALHMFLAKKLNLGPMFVGDLDTFRRYCGRIGIFRKAKQIK